MAATTHVLVSSQPSLVPQEMSARSQSTHQPADHAGSSASIRRSTHASIDAERCTKPGMPSQSMAVNTQSPLSPACRRGACSSKPATSRCNARLSAVKTAVYRVAVGVQTAGIRW
jgi:hypothetical protein